MTLLSKYNTELENDFLFTIPIALSNPVVYLYSECVEDCKMPATVYVYISKVVSQLEADYINITGGSVTSITHLVSNDTEGGDVYMLYVQPAESNSYSITLSIPMYVMKDNENHFNRESNSLTINFRKKDHSITSSTSPYTNMNPYQVFFIFPEPIARLFEKEFETSNCEVVDLSIINRDVLRVVVSIQSEGESTFVLPQGLAMSISGDLSQEVTWTLYYELSRPEGVFTCDSDVIGRVPIGCYLRFSKTVLSIKEQCIDVGENGIITDFEVISDLEICHFSIDGKENGPVSLYLKDKCVQDRYGNWNIRSNRVSLRKGTLCLIL